MAFFDPSRRSYISDPYPALARLRREQPVFRSPDFGAWILTAYADCARVLRDEESFASNPAEGQGHVADQLRQQRDAVSLGDAEPLVRSDPPVHTRLRQGVNHAFTPARVAPLRPFIEQTVASLLDRAPRGEPFEVMGGLAEPLPIAVVLELMQAPAADRPQLAEWMTAIMRARVDQSDAPAVAAAAQQAQQSLSDYFTAALADGATPAGGGVLATLMAPAEGREALTAAERVKIAMDLSIAGNNSTAFMIGNGVLTLVQHPQQAERLREDPQLLARAVDEMLRFDSSNQIIMRFAKAEATVGRQTVKAGDAIFVLVGAANRDGGQFPEPDRFDPLRENAHRHLSFGLGIHYCLGMPLLRLQAQIALSALLERFGELRFGGGGLLRGGTLTFRGPQRLSIAAR